MKLTAVLARREVPPAFKIKIGATVGFDHHVDAPVEIHVEGHLLARGEAVVVQERVSVRITERLEARHPSPSRGTLEVVLATREDGEAIVENIAPGFMIQFEKSQHDTVEVLRDGRLTARGYITVLGDRVGVKIVELVV